MQQTEKYHFNIIETSDTFSPEALNENARAAEKELARVEATLSNHENRIVSLELHRMAMGSYRGNHGAQTIDVGFTPTAVFIQSTYYNGLCGLAVNGIPVTGSDSLAVLQITDSGFTVRQPSDGPAFNSSNFTYFYLAFV